jgi:hypothetical protein
MTRLLILVFVAGAASYAAQSQLNYELNALAGYGGEEAVFTVPDQRPGVGIEYFRVLTGEYGDIGRVNVKARLAAGLNGRYEAPYILTPFGGNDEAELPAIHLELHNAYAHFKLNRGRSDLWLGRRDVAFGLGLSALYSRILPTMEPAVMSDEPKTRVLGSIDLTLLRGRFGIRAEHAIGRVADAPAGGVCRAAFDGSSR